MPQGLTVMNICTEPDNLNILFLSSRIPYPPDRGDKVRLQYVLQALKDIGSVTIACFVDPATDTDSMQELGKQFPDVHYVKHSKIHGLFNLFLALLRKIPFQVAFYTNANMQKTLNSLCRQKNFDVIYTHLIRMVPYALPLDKKRVILDYTDCISLEYKRSLKHRSFLSRIFFTLETKRTARYEQAVKSEFAENWVISPVDLKTMQMQSDPRCILIPNMVSVPDAIPQYSLKHSLVFSGNMSVPHNVTAANIACENIMPAILRHYPKIVLNIIGASPLPSILALAGKNNTQIRGFVPDLYQELQHSDIFLAPLYYCAGVQNKVLEAMACGIPVVTTTNVIQALGCEVGVEIIAADTDKQFVQKCLNLLANEGIRQDVGMAGRAFVSRHFSVSSVRELIKSRFYKIAKSNPSKE
jgi:polysaccharide biosynthesis protein PslH